MKEFLDDDFLLTTQTARQLYHDYAARMPILDYHCHLDPKEIFEDRRFDNMTQIWLGGDHYKWRLMRSAGVEERFITGDAGDREKFQKWAETLEMAIGNPLYHWSHLELKRYIGYDGCLNGRTAQEVWELCSDRLQHDPEMSVRGLMRRSGVTLICTTDDPADSLEYHDKIAGDDSFAIRVLPAWRPDQAMNVEAPEYPDYLKRLEAVSGVKTDSFAALLRALETRMDYFARRGCRVSDHGLEYVMFAPAPEAEIERIFRKRMAGEPVSRQEEMQFKTAFLQAMGRRYHARGWVMQLHYGCRRDNNTLSFRKLGRIPALTVSTITLRAPSLQIS